MRVLIVDDELESKYIEQLIREQDPGAKICVFESGEEALKAHEKCPFDVAVLDTRGRSGDGLVIAGKMTERHPRLNLVFVTAHEQYALDAFRLNASAYLIKPVSSEDMRRALTTLRFPCGSQGHLYVKCFGNFTIFYDGKPVHFRRAKTKELFAYLFDRKGAGCTTKEILCALWEDEGHESYYKQIRKDLLDTFTELHLENLIVREVGRVSVMYEAIDSDLKDYLNGKKTADSMYFGEYMMQYSWAEHTNAWLQMREAVEPYKK